MITRLLCVLLNIYLTLLSMQSLHAPNPISRFLPALLGIMAHGPIMKTKHLLHRIALGAALLSTMASAHAQTVSYSGGTITENFDSMGPAGTNTPLGWFVGYGG